MQRFIQVLIDFLLNNNNNTLVNNNTKLLRWFLRARRYASAGNRNRNVSVRLSVRPSVRHAPVLCQNEES